MTASPKGRRSFGRRPACARFGPASLVLFLFCCVGAGAPGCSVSEESADLVPHDVLLITVDTARADRYSYTGTTQVETAVADALARRGTAFLSAFAPSPITLVSHASLMTGIDPPSHGVRNNGEFALAPEAETLAEILRDRGWDTAAFVGAAVLDSRYGLDQGFTDYDDQMDRGDAAGMFSYARRRGDEVVEAALRWLEGKQSQRTFVWVHLYDPHAPYRPPEPELSRYAGRPYDGAIAFSDRVVGSLLDGYRRQNRLDRSLVVLTSDHGESLGAHGESTHGVFVYDETIKVPLVISGPGVPAGRRVSSPVALIDVMPTVLSLLGALASPDLDGRDLSPLMLDGTSTEQASSPQASADTPAVYVESLLPELNYGWSALRGLRTERWKLIRGAGLELYDLEADPSETVNVVGSRPNVVARLEDALDEAAAKSPIATPRRLEVDEATRRQLAALGYAEMANSGISDPTPPDPRIQIRVLERMNAALSRFAQGETKRALAELEVLVREDPGNLAASFNLAQLRFRLADYSGAAKAYRRAASLAPGDPKYREYEGLALERDGRLAESLRALDAALAIDPGRRGSKAIRWRVLARLGWVEELIADLEEALGKDPSDGIARVQLLRTRYRPAAAPELVAALDEAHLAYPEDPAINSALAHALMASGEESRAEVHYRRVLEALPGDHDSSLVLGRLALARGNAEEAKRILEAGVRKHADRPAMQIELARARLALGDLEGAGVALSRAHRLAPGSAHLWLVSGELSIRAGNFTRAGRDLDKAAVLGSLDEKQLERLAAGFLALGLDPSTEAVAERRAAAGR